MNIIIGKNNRISETAIIHNNVVIGDNNFIGDNVTILPNTVIGNNNNFFNGNVIGEFAMHTSPEFVEYDLYKCKGVIIGDNNLFHVKNIIFSGIDNKTFIGNNNKILGECNINHDVKINNNITLYPRVMICGYCELLDYSNIGTCAVIHQRIIIGQYSMIGGNNMVTKNVFPYYINIDNRPHRLNNVKISENVKSLDNILRQIQEGFINKDFDLTIYELPSEVTNDLILFISKINKSCI
jgi:UDP-N-acetylglucosamine acyltransferase